jgi:hypothetical protein
LASFLYFHNRRFALLPSALKGYLSLPQVLFGVLVLQTGAAISVSNSHVPVSSNGGSAATSQSPELGDFAT